MKRLFTPPLFLLTRLILPLGLPLLTLGYTQAYDLNPIARHLVFFGACGVAMGFAIEQAQARSAALQARVQRQLVTSQLRLLISSSEGDDDLKAKLHQIAEDLENVEHLK